MTQGNVSGLSFPCIARAISRPPSHNPPRLVLKSMSHQLRGRHKTQMLAFVIGKLEMLSKRKMCMSEFYSPLEKFAFLLCLTPYNRACLSLELQFGTAIGWFSHSQRASTSDIWCYHQRRPSTQSQRCTVTKRRGHSYKTHPVVQHMLTFQILLYKEHKYISLYI